MSTPVEGAANNCRAVAGRDVTIEYSLAEFEERRIGPREAAEIEAIRTATWLRVVVTLVLLGMFAWLNYRVMNLVREIFVETGSLDPNIVMALIGGTVSQVAAMTFIVLRYFFPSRD